MEINQILQLIIGVSILFVWLVRSNVPTNFRVGNANTLQGELTEVGLPDWFYDIIKIVKPIFAFFLLIGLLYSPITFPCMVATTIFMLGAVGMHIYAKDNFLKVIPALTLLIFCFIVFVHS